MKAYRKRWHLEMAEFIDVSDDEDELMELLSNAHSMTAIAENLLKMRKRETQLIQTKLKKLRGERQVVRVSDHAVVRYLERITGIDIDAVRSEMLAKMPTDYKFSDNVEYLPVDGSELQYIVRDGLIVTVSPIREVQ